MIKEECQLEQLLIKYQNELIEKSQNTKYTSLYRDKFFSDAGIILKALKIIQGEE